MHFLDPFDVHDGGAMNVPASATNVVALAAGVYHSLALKADGTVVVWGDNGDGWFTVPDSVTNIVALAAGEVHNLALKADGTVIAWGYNGDGQTNVPARVNLNLPVSVSGAVDTNTPGTYSLAYTFTDSYGTVQNTNRTVVVVDRPSVTSLSASLVATNPAVGTRTALLTATVNPNGLPTTAFFQFGATNLYPINCAPVTWPARFDGTNLVGSLDELAPGFTRHWRVVASNSWGQTISPEQTLAIPARLSGDLNGDGVVDQGEFAQVLNNLHGNGVVSQSDLNLVLSSYWPASPWLQMTNPAGLGGTNITFALTNAPAGAFSVEFSTNLTDWQFLGPATPRYEFSDTNAPALSPRYYRLRWP